MKAHPPIVSAVPVDTYEPSAVRSALDELLSPFGALAASFRESPETVLKPNFLRPTPIKAAVTTHPEIIRAVADFARRSGARKVIVTDSPGMGTARKCAAKLDLELDGDVFEVTDADDPIFCEGIDKDFGKIRLSERMVNADMLINVAKVKTHAQMGMTLAVKNTFGTVVGMDKAQWHFRAGRDPLKFAGLVVRIHEKIAPGLNILDGIVGMEGNGPGSGDPRPLGFLMASPNAYALDTVLCRTLGVDPLSVYTLKAAEQMGIFSGDTPIEIVGPPVSTLRPTRPWRPARPVTSRMVGTRWLSPVLESFLSVSPRIDKKKCTLCLRCIECCAAGALTREDASNEKLGFIKIDNKKCISCFCCQEMCPVGAVTVRASLPARLLGLDVR